MDDVAAATGLGKGSLYGAFGDKHQLFLRTFDGHCAGLMEAVRRRSTARMPAPMNGCARMYWLCSPAHNPRMSRVPLVVTR